MREDGHQGGDREQGQQQIDQLLKQVLSHHVQGLLKGEGARLLRDQHQLAQVLQVVIREPHQHCHDGKDQGRRDHLLAFGHLPLLARIAQLLGGGLFGLLTAHRPISSTGFKISTGSMANRTIS